MHYNIHIYSAAGSFHHPPGAFPLYLPKSREMEAARAAFFFSFRAAACVHFSFDIQHRERAEPMHNAQKDQTSSFAGAARSKPARCICRVHHTAAFLDALAAARLYTTLHINAIWHRSVRPAAGQRCSFVVPDGNFSQCCALRFLIFLRAAATTK